MCACKCIHVRTFMHAVHHSYSYHCLRIPQLTEEEATEEEGTASNVKDKEEWVGDDEKMMTYTMQANKRTHCQRLTSFIRLCDYIVANMLHNFAVKSVETLLNNLQEQVAKTVEIVDLVAPVKLTEDGEEVEDDIPIPRIPTDMTSPRVSWVYAFCIHSVYMLCVYGRMYIHT